MTIASPRALPSLSRSAIAASQPARSSSVNGVPALIFATFSGG